MRNILRSINNSFGLTIIQALVGSFVASIVALGVATMLVNSKIQTRKIQLMNTLTEQKARIEFLLRDQGSFEQSLSGGLNNSLLFVNLRTTALVTEQPYATSATKFVIYDSAGVVQYDMLNRTNIGPLTANGVTERGNPCTTFNGTAGAGTDDCPISYRILLGADCPQGTSCLDPQLKIVARMIFNPSSAGSSQLNKFRTLLPVSSTDSIDDSGVDGKYDAVVKRTASSNAKAFQLSVDHPNLATTHLGGCWNRATSPFWVIHPVTSGTGWIEDYDPHDLVTPNPGGVAGYGKFVFKKTGYFSCTLTVPAYSVGPFSIRIFDVTASASKGTTSSVAVQNSEAIARLETSFYVSNLTDAYEVEMQCDAPSTYDDLGMSKPAYVGSGGTTFPLVVLKCSYVDTAF